MGPMTTPRALGGLVACGGALYAVGGATEMATATRLVSRYDPSTDSWSDVAPLSLCRFDAGSAAHIPHSS